MGRLLLFAVCGVLLVAAGATANTPPPPPVPPGHKVVKPRLSFEGLEKHTDYVFYLTCWKSGDNMLLEVKDSSVLELDFGTGEVNPRVNYAKLVAMDRKSFDKRKADDPSLKWLTYYAVGVHVAELAKPNTTMPITLKEVPVTTYRVTLKEGVLKADKVEDKKGNKEPQSSLLPTWAFGIVVSLSVSWLGIWFARRGLTAKAN